MNSDKLRQAVDLPGYYIETGSENIEYLAYFKNLTTYRGQRLLRYLTDLKQKRKTTQQGVILRDREVIRVRVVRTFFEVDYRSLDELLNDGWIPVTVQSSCQKK